jgi:uncharacterized protein (DUF2126 family)
MSIKIALNHKTLYKYSKPVNMGPQLIRLRPAPHTRTEITSYSLKIKPEKHFINWQQDAYGNYIARVVFPEMIDHFSIEMDLRADMTVINPFDFFLEKTAENFPFKYETHSAKELAPFFEIVDRGALLEQFIKEIDLHPKRTINFLMDLNQKVHKRVKYLIRLEPGVQTSEETLTLNSGSCRDSAWLMVQILRYLGLAARFASGYSVLLKPDTLALGEVSTLEEDFADLHAWAEVFLPGAGWVGLDPSSGLLVGEGAIPLACTADPTNAAPVTGSLDECEVEFEHSMSVTRIEESPRTTLPYQNNEFQQINALGKKLDKLFKKLDLRLTIGGEPTFVDQTNQDSPEWNTAALGPTKKNLAHKLLLKLKSKWSQGALLHYGQGKWYPGEPLPRWSLSCFWREDGVEIWKDHSLIADENQDYNFTNEHAEKFISKLSQNLSIPHGFTIPAYEDTFHYLLQEQKLPLDLDPFDSKLDNELDRERLRKIYTEGLKEIVGFVLPIKPKTTISSKKSETVWQTSSWGFRAERLYLVPGDSPIGFRLPLNSLIHKGKEEASFSFRRDPTDDTNLALLPEQGQKITNIHVLENEIVRTAICLQARQGKLYVFMPPCELIEDYLTLIQIIEKTSADLKFPIIIEGYEPPYDSRIKVLKVTPDPGVIEVNITPSENWDELVAKTETLYQSAKETGLQAEKFMLDGKHTGTGGGNHIVLGAKTPLDSPFLRRPDLLASFISYWNNHPSLSYMFSGLFIGPTSQAPRIDEGRQDSLYELDIALQEIKNTKDPKPWFIDRTLRHLLVDLTGNTHRAEFCIDKLYSPDSSSGRLGLLELRGFEMTPHYEMNLAMQVLINSLIAMFWQKPYQQRLTRWGTALHDKFMLPYFVWQDFKDVIHDLNNNGIDIKLDFFKPHFEFRFPFYGAVNYGDIKLTLRSAIEPWYVLGEEPSYGGTARFVDSSLERLQIEVEGLKDDRYIVTCNNRKLPLYSSDKKIAGLRYRAWHPYSCLHPSIPVHTPLVFDVVDTWNKKSIGACTYHVSHPAGRNYTNFPINAREAESRRSARFVKSGHSPGSFDKIPADEFNPDFPCTLDLRIR